MGMGQGHLSGGRGQVRGVGGWWQGWGVAGDRVAGWACQGVEVTHWWPGRFPPQHFGKLYGLAMALSALVALLQYPCVALVRGPLGGDPFYVSVCPTAAPWRVGGPAPWWDGGPGPDLWQVQDAGSS